MTSPPPNGTPHPPQALQTPSAEPSSDSAPAIQELSRLLLSGWTMLAETCPRPNCTMPLARSRSNRVICTSCGLDVHTGASSSQPPSIAQAEVKHEENSANGRVENGPSTAMVPAGRRISDANMSELLGDKLLQGWTMMEDACGRCGVPLLKDNGGRIICVACPTAGTGDTEEEAGRELMTRASVQVGRNVSVGNVGGEVVATGGRGGTVAREGSPVRRRSDGSGEGRRRGVGVPPRVGAGPRINALPGIERVNEGTGVVGVVDIDVDVQRELWLSELEAARGLQIVRRRMEGRHDLERLKQCAETMKELGIAIRELRDARRAVFEG